LHAREKLARAQNSRANRLLPICSALTCLWFSHSPYAHIRMATPHTVLQAPERLISGLPALCVRTTLSVLRGLLLRGEFCASLSLHLFHAASVLVWSCGWLTFWRACAQGRGTRFAQLTAQSRTCVVYLLHRVPGSSYEFHSRRRVITPA
jgi:hypothetical protein